ncbi:hypothetical protein [Streptomyces pseudogriseolus]|uniref:hypothetical protein n=1 Tax=Streptomyces pseudogriseolus TaxID=36817 RepID=UPI003FA2316B
MRRLLAGQRAGHGNGHPLVLGVLIQLSRAQYAQGKRGEAAGSAREVAEQRATFLGANHPETVAAAWYAEVGAEPPGQEMTPRLNMLITRSAAEATR